MVDVFISYSKARRAEAAELARELGDLGYEIWWDTSLVPTGSFAEEIDRQLDAATAVIVIWSPESVRSNWVRSEAMHAERQKKLVNAHTSEISDPSLQIPKPFDITHSVLVDELRVLVLALDRLQVTRSGGASMDATAEPVVDTSVPERVQIQQPSGTMSQPEHDWQQHGLENCSDEGLLRAYEVQYAKSAPLWAYKAKQCREGLEWEIEEEQQSRAEGAMDFLVGIGDAAQKLLLEPGDIFRDFDEGPEMVVIPPGKFMMGSPDSESQRDNDEIQHEVTISSPFAMGRYAVTFDEWDAYVAQSGGAKPEDEGWGRGRRPVINVSWEDALAYTKWLNDKTGKTYRLPTEAEWEYACRAGTDTPFWCGSTITTDQANFNGGSPYNHWAKGEFLGKKIVSVDSFEPNPFGLYQVHGNVREWCNDWYGGYKEGPQTDPKGLDSGSLRVLRGGSWDFNAWLLRSAHRLNDWPGGCNFNLGFRLARDA